MDETFRQISELLLGSIPTIIFFLLLYGLYTVLVHKPLMRVLAERRARTQGAIEKARADIALAERRTAEYEQKLRDARIAILKAQEARRARSNESPRRRRRPGPHSVSSPSAAGEGGHRAR